jgi:CRP/FNR family transcriptional regulator
MSISTIKDGWQELASISSRKLFPVGSKIFVQGATPQAVYFINRGLIKLVRVEADGKEVIIGLRPPNRWFGTATAIARRPYSLTAVALTECELQCISTNSFLHLIETDAQFARQILQACSSTIIALHARLSQLAGTHARQRLEHLLWQLLLAQGLREGNGAVRLSLPLKRQEIAQMLAVAPAYVSELLTQLAEEGLIQREGRDLIIVDTQLLWREPDYEQF